MKQATKYDTNGDGLCDVDACKNVLAIGVIGKTRRRSTRSSPRTWPPSASSWTSSTCPTTRPTASCWTRPRTSPFSTGWNGWIHDYPDGYTWFFPLYYGPSIVDQYNSNDSMVGATPEQLKKYGYSVTTVPGMDSQIEACFPKTGDERVQCWADNDKYLMEQIDPIVPLVFSNTVQIMSAPGHELHCPTRAIDCQMACRPDSSG